MPISEQAYDLCGEPGHPDQLVFEGLPAPSWISKPLAKWIEASGITKHITFHQIRHTAATMFLTLGASIYVVSKILGHKSIKMTEIYAKIVDKKKLETVNLVNGMFDQIPVIQ